MKKFTLTLIIVSFAMILFAQPDRLRIPWSMQSPRIKTLLPAEDPAEPLKPLDYFPSAKTVSENVIGTTKYDIQTNSSCQNRLYYYSSDSTMGGTWTFGTTPTQFPERGTGYNFNNGTSWGTAPNSRIENETCGWPSYAPLGASGEIVVSNTKYTGLKICTRPVRGTGNWTQTLLPGPPGVADIRWPRAITTGPDNMYVHIIACTYHPYLGQNFALLYYRSLDGGQNWDKINVILPGMGSGDYLGFNGDDYAWAEPQGDTICFAVCGQWVDGFFMRSFDNGETWNKTVFFTNGHSLTPNTTPVPPFACLDGSVAIQLDHTGKAHVVVGRMYASSNGTYRYYYPSTDGLIYWNEDMPPLADSLRRDTLELHGQWLGNVVEPNQFGDSIVGFPDYGVALSSFPQMTIDENDYIYVLWSGVTAGNPSPGGYNYRHLWGRGSLNGGQTWADMYDFNQGLPYNGKEYVYPSMAKFSPEGSVGVIYQTADLPGSAVKDPAHVPYHDNTIEYRSILKSLFLPVGFSEQERKSVNRILTCYPNPASDKITVNLNLATSSRISVRISNLAGQTILTSDMGQYAKGENQFTIGLDGLRAGAYFLSVTMNGETRTSKLIVE